MEGWREGWCAGMNTAKNDRARRDCRKTNDDKEKKPGRKQKIMEEEATYEELVENKEEQRQKKGCASHLRRIPCGYAHNNREQPSFPYGSAHLLQYDCAHNTP